MSSHYSNPQLKNRYEQNTSFRQAMDSNQKNYEQRKQQCIYCDLTKINPKILQISSQLIDETNHNGSKIYSEKKHILYVYSHFQPDSPQELNKFFLYFIQSFPQPKQPFQLIYVNSSQSGKSKCWSNFKTLILEELPLKYLLHMEKLILIRPSFLDKASSIVQFGVLNKFINNKLQKFDSLKTYFESTKKKFEDMKKIIPMEVLQQDQPGLDNVLKAMPFFICNFNQNRTSVQGIDPDLQLLEQKKPQISITNQSKHKNKKKGLENYPSGEFGIPLALQLLIFYFTEVPVRCETEGLFRKCTSIDDEKLLITELQRQNYEVLTALENEIAVASTMKRFLGNLEPPVIPYENYERLTANHSLNSIISEVHSFPIINFMTLMHTLKFLRHYIIPREKKNLMPLENVAICFAPCFMRSKQITTKQFMLATINVEITRILLENFEEIFGDSKKQHRISSKAYKIYRKNSKFNEESPNKKINQQTEGQQTIGTRVKQSEFECPSDFLGPAVMLLEDQRESEVQRYSQRSGQHNNELISPEVKQNQRVEMYEQKKISGITLSSTKTRSGILLKEEDQQDSMKKQKSHKRLPFPQQENNLRKSDTDSIDFDQEEVSIKIPNSQGVDRLNKLRANRSRMGNQ